MQWYDKFLKFISESVGHVENLAEDLEIIFLQMQSIRAYNDTDDNVFSPQCYGAAMFICASIEKILRTAYIHLLKDKTYVPLTSATLGSLLSPKNQEMVKIFGEDHLKNLSYFLCTIGDKRIGLNIRNSLAHWTGIRKNDLTNMLVYQVFYLYTDIINTLVWYFYRLQKEGNLESS